jgi:hypothetical protein
MLFVALFALCLVIPHLHGWQAGALILAFTIIMWHLLQDLREKT